MSELSTPAERDAAIRALGLPALWMSDIHGVLTPEQSALLLRCSLERVAAGLPPLRGIYGPWRYWGPAGCVPGTEQYIRPVLAAHGSLRQGSGYEATGRPRLSQKALAELHRRAAEDAALLASGCALLEPDGTVRLP